MRVSILGAIVLCATGALITRAAGAAELSVPMYEATLGGAGQQAGSIVVRESSYGLLFQVNLEKLPGGTHGFHVHERLSCAPGTVNGKVVAAGGAGGHWDPTETKRHAGPYGDGHRGDLPRLHADADGRISELVLAPRIHTLDELRGRALMVHAGGDNFADDPMPLGGGGVRILCGVVPPQT
ncbi:superoxide dismutase family protein [Caballeronia sp. EK]|uniref:superoxide dismutase family protein n=1 Tax=Caballeronia sp. EK TaxID=2767469 RepID=UPI0016554472|nr:superoxide dismutase family protein [Caballeronia sp. EK]MBC8642030.1 superoxide dismutase family protein [Caballeronia sp. EK]